MSSRGAPVVLAVALASAVAGGGCLTVQTRVSADVIVETASGHTHYAYEATESHDVAALALVCAVTAIWYGGACWAYLAVPFDGQEELALRAAERDIVALGTCAHLQRPIVEAVGWNGGQRRAHLRDLRGERIDLVDARRLCAPPSPHSPPSPHAPPSTLPSSAAPASPHGPPHAAPPPISPAPIDPAD